MKALWAVILRFVRVALGQLIGVVTNYLVTTYGGITIPLIGITVGAGISALFKALRDAFPAAKYPKTAAFLTLFPL